MDNFQQTLMEQALLDHRVELSAETAEAYSKELLVTPSGSALLTKKLFHKIAKGGFIRGPTTSKFMSDMLAGSW